MFDTVDIIIKAGKGGNGAVSFRHEKYVPFGGPDGGDGGDGGNIVVTADTSITNLRMYVQKRLYKAGDGKQGGGQKKHGKRGEDLLLKVPVGTVVLDKGLEGDEVLVADLEEEGQQAVVAQGGRAGAGNTRFATSTNQAPRIAQKGAEGEEREITLELRLIADIGIVGYPNAGKSTLLTAVSAAKPKIASYPFTTRQPIVGVVERDNRTIVMAEVPGLIDGAHTGRGLGHQFLRHVERTRVIIHLVDGNSDTLVEDMVKVNAELGMFDPELMKKPQLLAINKIDIESVHSRMQEIKEEFESIGIKPHLISAVTGEGVKELVAAAIVRLDETADKGARVPKKVFHPQPKYEGPRVRIEDGVFIITAPELERLVAGSDMSNPEVRRQINIQLMRLGIIKVLEKVGAQPGSRLRCGDIEWEW